MEQECPKAQGDASGVRVSRAQGSEHLNLDEFDNIARRAIVR
jgi:hypothetical protein